MLDVTHEFYVATSEAAVIRVSQLTITIVVVLFRCLFFSFLHIHMYIWVLCYVVFSLLFAVLLLHKIKT